MIYILLILIITSLFSISFSLTLEGIIGRERRTFPVAAQLYKTAQQENLIQAATTRVHSLRPIVGSPDSPSQTLTPLRKERKALAGFTEYMHDHIPTNVSPKNSRTPLNPATVLRAAFPVIKVGPDSHFKSYVFFSLPGEEENAQMVLQASIDLTAKDSKGWTNEARMEDGKSPVGPDKKKINLHHLLQEDGLLLEVTRRFHNTLHPILHYKLKKGSSTINRNKFARFREAYWKERVTQLKKKPLAGESARSRRYSSPKIESKPLAGKAAKRALFR